MNKLLMKKQIVKILFLSFSVIFLNCESAEKKDQLIKKEYGYYNVHLESQDRGIAKPEEDRTVYYKIFLDRELAAKTSSGLFFQKKQLNLHLNFGRYLFFAERWYLEESSESDVPEYKRANNVWQMKPIYIDIPEKSELFKMIFGIDHNTKEFYYEIKGVEKTPPVLEEEKESK